MTSDHLLVAQMHIDSHDALGVLNSLFETLAPSSLRPVDMLLRSMFVVPYTMVSRARGGHSCHIANLPMHPRCFLIKLSDSSDNLCTMLWLDFWSPFIFIPQASVSTVQLWISGILAILRVLISQSTEDIVLSRIQELSFSPLLISCQNITRLRNRDINHQYSEENADPYQIKVPPEETFSR